MRAQWPGALTVGLASPGTGPGLPVINHVAAEKLLNLLELQLSHLTGRVMMGPISEGVV